MRRWTKWVIAILMLLGAVVFIAGHNWAALVMTLCVAWICFLMQQTVKHYEELLSRAENHPSWLMCVDAERKAELYKENLGRALKNLVKLKERMELMTILNKNLIENSNQKSKNYAPRRSYDEFKELVKRK